MGGPQGVGFGLFSCWWFLMNFVFFGGSCLSGGELHSYVKCSGLLGWHCIHTALNTKGIRKNNLTHSTWFIWPSGKLQKPQLILWQRRCLLSVEHLLSFVYLRGICSKGICRLQLMGFAKVKWRPPSATSSHPGFPKSSNINCINLFCKSGYVFKVSDIVRSRITPTLPRYNGSET